MHMFLWLTNDWHNNNRILIILSRIHFVGLLMFRETRICVCIPSVRKREWLRWQIAMVVVCDCLVVLWCDCGSVCLSGGMVASGYVLWLWTSVSLYGDVVVYYCVVMCGRRVWLPAVWCCVAVLLCGCLVVCRCVAVWRYSGMVIFQAP